MLGSSAFPLTILSVDPAVCSMGESQASSQRKRPAAQHEHEHEFAGDEQPTKRIMLSSTTQVQEVENSILACPMYKYDPVMYRQCAKYLAGGSTTLNRIRLARSQTADSRPH